MTSINVRILAVVRRSSAAPLACHSRHRRSASASIIVAAWFVIGVPPGQSPPYVGKVRSSAASSRVAADADTSQNGPAREWPCAFLRPPPPSDPLRSEKPAANLGALPMHTDPSGAAGLRPDFEAIPADVREHGNRDRQRTRESRKSLGAPDRQTVSPPLRRASPTSTRKNALRHL